MVTNELKPGTVMWTNLSRLQGIMPQSFTECKIISFREDGLYRVVLSNGSVLDIAPSQLVSKEELPQSSADAIFAYSGDDCPDLCLYKGALFYVVKDYVYSPALDIYFDFDYFHLKLRHLFHVVPRPNMQAASRRK